MAAKTRRYISPTTRDYVIESGGLRGDDGYSSKVILALGTELGSCQVAPNFGSRLHTIKIAGTASTRLAQKYGVEALAHIASEVKSLEVSAELHKDVKGAMKLTVSIDPGRGKQAVKVEYTSRVSG